jgi:hypothetical protein
MQPVNLDLSKYVVPPLPGTGAVTYHTEGQNVAPCASFIINGSTATITPSPIAGNFNFQFKVKQDAYEAIGTVSVTVYDYHGIPGLVNPYQFPTCYDYMGPVTFTSAIRFMTNYDESPPSDVWPNVAQLNGSNGNEYRIYGFSIPLVADLDGDGYPEIIALGRKDGTDSYNVDLYGFLDIYDGRTGILQSNSRLRLDMKTAGSVVFADHYGDHGSPGIFAVIDSDRDGKKEVIVAFPRRNSNFPYNGQIVSYEISKTKPFTMSRKWNTTYSTDGYAYHPVIQVADFDGDGRAELLVYNKIYDTTNGRLKLTFESFDTSAPNSSIDQNHTTTEAYTGRNTYDIRSWDDQVAFGYVYDVDLDGRYDVVAGGKVYYDIRLTASGTNDGSYKKLGLSGIGDGRTGVADMNGDGIPDIVVANRTSVNTTSELRLYVWNPGFLRLDVQGNVVKNYTPDGQGRNSAAPASFTPAMITNRSVRLATPNEGTNSYIYIGDIDGRVQTINGKDYRLPEVAVIAGHYTYTLNGSDYHPNVKGLNQIPVSTSSSSLKKSSDNVPTNYTVFGVLAAFTMDMADNQNLKPSFILLHNDRSGNTGFTMFDFDNDGIQEICYRDEATLRIIKANKAYVPIDEKLGNTVIFSKKCVSYTGYEYPAIADVDGDNSADIVVIGKQKTGYDTYGYVYVVGNADGDKFAPAWPVWNQFMYDPFKVTPDSLTTPWGLAPNRLDKKYNFVREIKDASGQITNTLTDFNPFNGTLRQATKLDAQAIPKYEPIVFLTEAYIISSPSDPLKPKIATSGSTHYIELTIGNKTSAKADISANTPITIYKQNTISEATFFKTILLQNVFKSGTTTKLGSNFSIPPGTTQRVWIELGAGAAVASDVYIVRLGDDSKKVGATWTWRFGYNGGVKYGAEYPCNDFSEGLGTANRAFRDCNWCDQVVRAAKYQTIRDLYTIQEFTDVTMDLLANDILPVVSLAGVTPTQSFMDTVRLNAWNIVTPPRSGYLTYNNVKGAGARITYHHDDRGSIPANIDSFQYRLTYYDDVEKKLDTKTSTVYIYILKSVSGGFSSCYGATTRIELQNAPSGVSFEWYKTKTSNVKLQTGNRVRITGQMKADSVYWLDPVTTGISTTASPGLTTAQLNHYKTLKFPRGELTVRLVNASQGNITKMRWTGHVDKKWKNPRNWVQVRPAVGSGKPQESPVDFVPSGCTDVIIPSDVNNYPELVDSAICNDIALKNRAMLANPHVLKYAAASVEIKLKPSERDRFVMWSAPLMSMYSGDYHYRNGAGDIKWGDVFMNMFQIANPDGGGTAEVNRFTATFADVTRALPLGTAFNLHVTRTSATRDSLLRFPRAEDAYTPAGGTSINLPSRANRAKFVTHGKTLDASGRFNLDISGNMTTAGTQRLVQVVNPYMAYLSVDSFLKYNSNISSGYYLWDGEVGTDMTAVAFTNGNRISVTTPLALQTSSAAYIPPLQSFFVATTTAIANVKMSPYWTTTSPVSSYILRAAKMIKSGGALNIRLAKGSQTAHAALLYTIGSSSFIDREDMPAIAHTVDNQTSLSLYTLSAGNEPLAINSSEHFDMMPVTLGITTTSAGEYLLEFSNLESFGYDVILVDKQKGNKQINLGETPEYRFAISKEPASPTIELNNRFELRFTYTGKGVTITGVEPIRLSPSLNVAAGRGHIQVSSTAGPIESIQVYDAAGRRIYGNPSVNSTQLRIPISSPPMMYIVKAMIDGELRIGKTIIK